MRSQRATARLRAAYGVYLLASRRVWAPRAGSTECDGLADPPREGEGFTAFGDALVRSERIASLLETK
jgi:carbonic anhydrase